MDPIIYRGVLAVVIIIILSWIALILYRVARGGAIKRVDFWKAKWKIVLFWMIIAAIVIVIWYLLNKYGILDLVSKK